MDSPNHAVDSEINFMNILFVYHLVFKRDQAENRERTCLIEE